MNHRSFFVPSPRRKRGLILTLSGSLLFHGSLIGVAALWPTHPAVEPKPTTTIIGEFGETAPPSEPLLPAAPPSEPEPVLPVLNAVEPATDVPPTVDLTAADMVLATPPPRSALRAPSRAVSPSPATRTARPVSSSPANGPSGGTAETPGAGRAGAAGVRWNTPKPAYPASLRLAHVQGSGSVRATTDGSGRVISAVIAQSTGNAILDDNTCRAARSDWSGPPNATVTVPITYHLH